MKIRCLLGAHRFASGIYKSVDNKHKFKQIFGDGTEQVDDVTEAMLMVYCVDCRKVFCHTCA